MVFYVYTCPDCGLIVRLEDPSDQLRDIKACACESAPVETVEEIVG